MLPKGFSFNGIHAGLKDNPSDLDLALIHSDTICNAAGVFTQNHCPGEPVKLGRERLQNGKLQSIIINSRISNVATGEKGFQDAVNICNTLAEKLNTAPSNTLISSTGIIGRPYPHQKIENNLDTLISGLEKTAEKSTLAAKAIMTTDTVHKLLSTQIDGATITVLAKGAGMIAPNMATMLVFILTDANIPSENLKPMLKRVCDQSFNCLSIDFDTSTSDTCILMANGEAGEVPLDSFETKLLELCKKASYQIVSDGEGVDKVISCSVEGAIDFVQARAVASSICNSPLVKTMITGADPNWGRIIMAIGKTEDSRLKDVQPSIQIDSDHLLKNGKPIDHDLNKLSQYIKDNETININVNLHQGTDSCHFLGANLTNEYVHINAEYTT